MHRPLPLLALLLALASGAMAPPASAQSITVAITADVPPGATLGVRGDTPPLAWDRSRPLTDADGDGVYTATIDFPDGTGTVAYKAVLTAPEAEPVWEPGGNRLLFPGRMTADRRAFGAAQTDLPALTVSSQQFLQDLSVLRSTIEGLHPGLRLHNSETDLARISDQLTRDARGLIGRYGEAIPMPAAYLPIAKAVAAIRDGHTQVSMYNQGEYLTSTLYTRPDRVPFAFRLIGGRMIVTGDATPEAALPVGTEILSLDGRPVAEVIADHMPYASADGSNDAKRVDQLQVNGYERVAERFDVIYSLLYAPEGPLALTVRRPDGSDGPLSVARMSQEARRDVLRERDPAFPRSDDDLFQFRMLDARTAYLKVGTFATFSLDLDYDAWLTDAFAQMNASGAERLIVDLRGNAGGMDDAATLLFRHLLREPATVQLWNGRTAYDVVPAPLRPHVRSWDSGFYDLSAQVTDAGDGTFRLPVRAPVTVPPAPEAFAEQVAVLVDAAASSATFYLANTIQQTGVAPLVGQVTGGSLKGLNAGQIAFLTLPNTGIVVDVPLFGSRPTEPGPDLGVTPDVLVAPDADAVIAGRDPEIEAALALFRDETSVSSTITPEASGARPTDALAGTWTVDLRPTPEAEAYTQPMVLRASGDGRLAGSFYGSPIENVETNDDWGDLRIAFVTRDGSGVYHHAARLCEGTLHGTTHSLGRGFLAVWTATQDAPEASGDAETGTPIPFGPLAGDWTGTLTYTQYDDDASRETLTLSASGAELPGGGVQLTVSFIEPNGSSGGTGTTTLRPVPGRADQVEYDDQIWNVLQSASDARGFTVTFEAEQPDNQRPATVRHTLTLRDGVFTDRKEVRYEGTDAFFERNTFRFTREG